MSWMNKRVMGGLVTGLLAGAVAATGVTAFAAGDQRLPAATVGCTAPDPGDVVSFGPNRPDAE